MWIEYSSQKCFSHWKPRDQKSHDQKSHDQKSRDQKSLDQKSRDRKSRDRTGSHMTVRVAHDVAHDDSLTESKATCSG